MAASWWKIGKRNRAQHRAKQLRVEPLENRLLLAAQPVINEFLASNNGVVQDQDGDYSDFIELTNRGDQAVNLGGWYLTDDVGELTKWQFPSVNLAPGQFLVVFASNKDRAIAGSQLHTNFALSAGGEYLALVQPNGVTVASAFTPNFPQQYENVSYGVTANSTETNFIELGDASQVLVPTTGALGNTWVQPSFAPNPPWQSGPLGVGYGASQGPPVSTTVLQVDFNDRENTGNTQPGFSSFIINGTTTIQTAPVTRTFGNISVTLADASGLGYDDRSRTTPANSGTFTQAQLLQDFVFSRAQNGTGGLDVTLDGLLPNSIYTLTVWSFDTGSPSVRTSDWTANGIAVSDYSFQGSASPTSNDTYKFGFVVAANAQGRIVLQGRQDQDANEFAVFLNALRLETGDTLNPPPTTENVLRVDFNDRTEGEAGAANTEPGYSTMTLDENSATFNGIKVTLSPYGVTTLDDRDRAGPVDAGQFTLDQVYDDVVYAVGGGAGTGMEILLEGLVPNVSYDVLLRSYDFGANGTRQATWTEESSGQSVPIAPLYSFDGATPPATNDDFVMRASLTTSPQGTLLLRGVQVGSERSVMVNALELTRATFGGLIGTPVDSTMPNQNSSAYIRVPFAVTNLAAVDQLLLDMQYDAGFVAYLNGQEVARRNAPTPAGVPPVFNASATTERSNSEALTAETINLTQFKNLLNQSTNNVLAIHGLNSAAGDDDFLIAPQLRGTSTSGLALGYFENPTPGAANNAGVLDFVAAVQASVGHGFYEAPFSVSLATPTPGATIYYTFDGSVPSPTNPAAVLYTAPFNINRTTVLRTAARKDGNADSPVVTSTYIFLNDVIGQTINPANPASNPFGLAYPSLWQANAAGDYNMDPEVVAQWNDNNPTNQDFGIREALKSIPTMSIVLPHNDLWSPSTGIYPDATRQGDAWRKAGSVEYINPNTGEQFQYNVGIQMHGAASRDNNRLKKHSFRLIFNPEFDGPGRLDFPIFEGSDFADINTLVLKASFTDSFPTRTQTGRYSPLDSTYTRDVSIMDSQRAMGSLAPNATYVHLYINGLYWGLYYPTERTDDAYLASHLGGNEEDWDIIKDFNELFRGNKDAWNAMFALVNQLPGGTDAQGNAIYQQLQGRNADGTRNPALPVYLDMDNLIDYMILHLYAGVEDWPSHNWVAARNRVDPGSGFQFFSWDQEISWDGRYRDRTEVSDAFTPAELYDHLRKESPEFRLRFADRVQKHMFNDGALTVAATQDRWQARADQVEAAIIGESARWGDAREGEVVVISSPPATTIPVMTVDHWRDSIADVHDAYIPQSHPLTISRFTTDGLFPSIGAPQFNLFGGQVPDGFGLTMSTTSGGATIYYTTNGQDPRLLGGAINTSSATAYSGGVTIEGNTVVKARTRVGTTWSALTEATFVVSQGGGGVVISEINYHPHDVTPADELVLPGVVEDDFEFIEILNTHPTKSINLLNMALANGLSYTFGNVNLGPGQRALVVENAAAFQARYGMGHNVLGEWSGGASNSSETIELRDALNELLMSVTYADIDPWSEAADGDGATLELIDPGNTSAERLGKWYSWRASTEFGGTPGTSGTGSLGVVINEVRTHSNSPDSDAIELFNRTNQPINIGGWYLSDSGGSPLKFQIPLGTILADGEYIVFDEEDFNSPSLPPAQRFALNGTEGDDVFLVIADGDGGVSFIVDSVHFGAAFDGQSLGRVPNGNGRMAPLISNTFGGPNSNPHVGPLVISEINYQPGPPSPAALAILPSLSVSDLEFIEIHNPTGNSISLTNSGLAGGSSYGFTPGSSLASGKSLVLVSFDPALPANALRTAAFRAHYGIDGTVQLVGPFAGALGDMGARIELQIPDEPPPSTPSLFPKVLGDEVLYDNLAPWPEDAAGSGKSIQRNSAGAFGNDGNNWTSAIPTPGSVNFSSGLPGDFNTDGVLTLADLDILVAAVVAQSTDDNFDLNDDSSVNTLDIAYLVNTLVQPIAGDYDWNSVVNQADNVVWRSRFGSTLYLNADGNRNGVVDAADYVLWRNNLPAVGVGSATVSQTTDGVAAAAALETEGDPSPQTSTETSSVTPAQLARALASSERVEPVVADTAITRLYGSNSSPASLPRIHDIRGSVRWLEVRGEDLRAIALARHAFSSTAREPADRSWDAGESQLPVHGDSSSTRRARSQFHSDELEVAEALDCAVEELTAG